MIAMCSAKPANEVKLGGLQPGRDTIHTANHRFGNGRADVWEDADVRFEDFCNYQYLALWTGPDRLITKVAVGNAPRTVVDCSPGSYSRKARSFFGSGHGLLLGDSCDSTLAIYGKPESESAPDPSNSDIKSMTYDFSWAGSKVPQALEVQCSVSSNKVVKMTLSASKS